MSELIITDCHLTELLTPTGFSDCNYAYINQKQNNNYALKKHFILFSIKQLPKIKLMSEQVALLGLKGTVLVCSEGCLTKKTDKNQV